MQSNSAVVFFDGDGAIFRVIMMKTMSTAKRAALIVLSLLLSAGRGYADDVRVMTSGAFTAALVELAPAFERATRHRIVVGATTSSGPDSIQNRLQRGEPVDVIIMADTALDGFIKNGTLVAASRVDLVRSAIGMAVRAGAPRPDVSSIDAFTRALLQAKSIAYSASVSGVYLSTELFQRLGIADQVLPKSRRIEGERVGTVVARGDAEVGFQQVSELLPVPGIELIGPLPPDVQRLTVFSAAIATSASAPDAARALLAFFMSPEAAPIIRRTGLEPIAGSPSSPPKVHEAAFSAGSAVTVF
jgi:molybdate transport system substrate-binding protein